MKEEITVHEFIERQNHLWEDLDMVKEECLGEETLEEWLLNELLTVAKIDKETYTSNEPRYGERVLVACPWITRDDTVYKGTIVALPRDGHDLMGDNNYLIYMENVDGHSGNGRLNENIVLEEHQRGHCLWIASIYIARFMER